MARRLLITARRRHLARSWTVESRQVRSGGVDARARLVRCGALALAKAVALGGPTTCLTSAMAVYHSLPFGRGRRSSNTNSLHPTLPSCWAFSARPALAVLTSRRAVIVPLCGHPTQRHTARSDRRSAGEGFHFSGPALPFGCRCRCRGSRKPSSSSVRWIVEPLPAATPEKIMILLQHSG